MLHAVGCGREFLAARGYRAAKARPPRDPAIRDEMLIADPRTVDQQNFSGYGVKKIHVAMRRRGWQIGREQPGGSCAPARGAQTQAGVHQHRRSGRGHTAYGTQPVQEVMVDLLAKLSEDHDQLFIHDD